MSAPADKVAAPPYVSFKTLTSFLNELRDLGHVPMQVDRTLMPKQSGSVINEILSAMRFLGLIDTGKGVPTPQYNDFVMATEAERKVAWVKILKEPYAFIFKADNFDIERATGQQVNDLFRARNVNGSTLSRAIAFFLSAAKEAGIKVSPSVKPPPVQKNTVAKTKKEKDSTPSADDPPNDRNPASLQPPEGVHRFELPIPGKASVIVWIPKELDGDDWDMFRDMFNLYVKRWKGFKESDKA